MQADFTKPVRQADFKKLLGRHGLQLSPGRELLKEIKIYKFICSHVPGWTIRSGHVYSILEVCGPSLVLDCSFPSSTLSTRWSQTLACRKSAGSLVREFPALRGGRQERGSKVHPWPLPQAGRMDAADPSHTGVHT